MTDDYQERYQKIVSILNRARSKTDLEFLLQDLLGEMIGIIKFPSGVIRINSQTGETGLSIDTRVGSARFCFENLNTPDCVCREAWNLAPGEVRVTDDFARPDCREARFCQVAVAGIYMDGVPGGLFMAASEKKVSPTPGDLRFVSLILTHIGQTVGRIRETIGDRELASDLETVNTVGRLITSQLTLRDMTREIVGRLSQVMETDEVNVIMYDDASRELSFLASYFANGSGLERPEVYPLSDGINSHIIKTRKPLLMTYDTRVECEKLGIRHGGKPAKSWLGAPMIYKDRVVGVLSVQSYHKKGLYGERSIKLLEIVAAQCAVAVENARLFEEVISREKEKEGLYFSLTHDLRSLVNPVSGFAKLLANTPEGETEKNISRLLNGIIKSSEKLTRFVDDILVYSKIKSGKLYLNLERADVMQCVKSAISLNLPEFAMRKLSVYINQEDAQKENLPGLCKVEGDFDVVQIERVLLNLITNAIKHANSRIDIAVREEEGEIICSVADDGPGVSQDQCEAIFDEYYQADSRMKGVGLGLPTVKKLVEMHHGEIFVASKPGEGFCVKFSWPRTLADRSGLEIGEMTAL